MPTIYIMRGLPASGKSTYAAALSEETGAEVVCRDELRMALHGQWWSGDKSKEREVTFYEKSLVVDNVKNGKSVIIDATHLSSSAIPPWKAVARQYRADIKVIDIPVDIETCIKRDAERAARGERSVGEEVIRRMANNLRSRVTQQ